MVEGGIWPSSHVIKNTFVNEPYEYSIGYNKARVSFRTLEDERKFDEEFNAYCELIGIRGNLDQMDFEK